MSDLLGTQKIKQSIDKNMKDPGSKKLLWVAGGSLFVIAMYLGYNFTKPSEVSKDPSLGIKSDLRADGSISGGNIKKSPPSEDYIRSIKEADEKRAAEQSGSFVPTIIPDIKTETTLDIKEPERPAVVDAPPQPNTTNTPARIERPVTQGPSTEIRPDQRLMEKKQQEAEAERKRIQDQYRENVVKVSGYMKQKEGEIKSFHNVPQQQIFVNEQNRNGSSGSNSATNQRNFDDIPNVSANDKIENQLPVPLPLAGSIKYGQMINRAISSDPGAVLVKILEGPYAGSKLIGNFQTGVEGLKVTLRTLSVENLADGTPINKTFRINAVLVDTKYLGSSVATDVDNHLFENLAFGFIDKFATGYAEVLKESGAVVRDDQNGNSTTYNPTLSTKEKLYVAGGEGVAETGRTLRKIYGDKPPTITIDADTPVGILFLDGATND